MRTGAIFARGSCWALKWMALVGMVFALGSAQAAAQPTVASGDIEYVSTSTSTTVTVEVTDTTNTGVAHPVTGNPNLTDFQMPAGTNPTAVSISGNVITLTFAGSTTGTPAFTYTQPGDTRRQITSVATGVALGNVSDTAAEKDLPPVFSVATGSDLMVRVNVAIGAAGLSLPRATSGNGTITYTVSPTLPAGLTLNQPATATAAPNITGTATAMTSGARSFQLAAADGDGNTAIGDIATVNFTITVGDVPAMPAVPMVTATGSMQASVTWVEPAINNFPITVYNLQYQVTGGSWINAGSNLPPSTTTTTVTFPGPGTYSVRVQAANSLGASPWSLGGPVTVTAAAPLVPPVLPTTAYTSRVGMAISPIELPATTGGFPPLTYSVSGQPVGLTFTTAAAGGGMLAGTPAEVTTGAQPVTYTVTDSDTPPAQQSATFTYTVTDVPGAPTALVFTPTASSTTLNVSWTAPTMLNNLPITGYDLEYMPTGGTGWTVTTTTSTSAVITVPAAGSYDVRVRARNADGPSGWLSGTGSTAPAPSTTLADITKIELSGVEERRIGGAERQHVDEGGNITVTVTVEWTVAQLREIYAAAGSATPAPVWVALVANAVNDGANWLSPAEVQNERGQDLPDAFEWSSRIDIPKEPPTTARDRDMRTAMGRISLVLLQDEDAEDEAFRLVVGNGSIGVSLDAQRSKLETDVIVIDDDEPQTIVVERSSSGAIYEGSADVEFEVAAKPNLVDLSLDVRLGLTDKEGAAVSSRIYGLSPATGTIPRGDDELVVTLDLDENDGNRAHDDFVLTVEVVSRDRDDVESATAEFRVLDVHRLPPLTSVMPPSATLMEGNELELTLTVDRNPRETRAVDPEKSQYTTEALSIAVMGSGVAATNYSLSATDIAVPKYEHKAGSDWTQTVKVTLEALSDEDVEEDSMLMLDFVVNGTVAANGPSDAESDGQASVTIQDATATLVSVRDNAYDVIQGALGTPPTLTTGMSGELTGANLFDYDGSAVSVAYATSVDGGAVTASASGGMVTIMGVAAGDAKVTITATATPNGSSLVVNQTKSNVAQLTFPVMVEDEPLTFTVMGPEDMNVAEGMSAMVTVMTNRPVSENTEVMLMRDGSSSASEDDYMLNPPLVTIMAGNREGSTMVEAQEDGMAEDMEMLTLFLVVDGMQMTDKSVSLYIWDEAVPALPVIAQLLLATFLAVGGYRRYRRR